MINFEEYLTEETTVRTKRSAIDTYSRMTTGLRRRLTTPGESTYHSEVFFQPGGHGYNVKMVTANVNPNHENNKLRYLRMAHENQDNIHFPRIDKMKDYVDPEGKKFNVSQIERLHPIKSLDRDEIESLHNSVFKHHPEYSSRSAEDLGLKLERAAKDPKFREENVHSGQMKEALAKIQHLHDTRRDRTIGIDLHSDNFMARRTKFGDQIVLTDPIA